MNRFNSLGISNEISSKLEENGIVLPTPIQEKTIPVILSGQDVIAAAQTGTGKTYAFTLPIIDKIDPTKNHIQALIIAPTRELALQVTMEIRKTIPDTKEIRVLSVYGGQDVEQQMKKLKGNIHIVIGTPGRLLDHIRRGTINLHDVSMLVLDEADQMLHIGFLNEVEDILKQIKTTRQTMLFSATIPREIRSLARRYMNKPLDIRIQQDNQIILKEIKQRVIETSDRAKQDTLIKMIDEYRPFLAIIFCRTKRRASILNGALLEQGYNSAELHGDLSQAKREQVMKNFRNAKLQLLVATDVAARGLDVEGVTHVFNYDIPHDVESYIHRIGRTGRAGGQGLAITFVAPKDRQYLSLIEKGINFSIKKLDMELQAITSSPSKGKRKQTKNDKGKVDQPLNRKRPVKNQKQSSIKSRKSKEIGKKNNRKSEANKSRYKRAR